MTKQLTLDVINYKTELFWDDREKPKILEHQENKRAKNAERQRRYKARQKNKGLITVSGLVHKHQAAAVYLMFAALQKHRNLEVGTLRDTTTQRLVSLNKPVRPRGQKEDLDMR